MTALRLTVVICLAFAFMVLIPWATLSLFAAEKPNIVVIYTDDQGYGDMSALNPNRPNTRHSTSRIVKRNMSNPIRL